MIRKSDNAAPISLLALIGAILVTGCNDSATSTESDSMVAYDDPMSVIGMGGDQSGSTPQPRGIDDAPPTPPGMDGARQSSRDAAPSRPWAIVLQTFTMDDHRNVAQQNLSRLQSAVSRLADARVVTTDNGSMIVYGRYTEPDEPQAQQDLEEIKSLSTGQGQPFARAMLSRVERDRGDAEADHPHSLMAARRQYPNIDPLYTLQVAAWSDFDSGQYTDEQVRQAARDYADRLRSEGYEAYFHHNSQRGVSIVTIGLFDHNDLDVEAGLYSPRLEQLMERFPHHLVNGETVEEPVSRRPARRGQEIPTQTQRTYLVEVPKP